MNVKLMAWVAMAGEILLATTFVTDVYGGTTWSYNGRNGPAHWADLEPGFGECAMRQGQSPVDIRHAVTVPRGNTRLKLDYRPFALEIVNTEHTLQVNVAPGSGGIMLESGYFHLMQIHFHLPAEERFDGKAAAMGAHFVLRSDKGALAVLAVRFVVGKSANDAIQSIIVHAPRQRGDTYRATDVKLDPAALLPVSRGYYTYQGSLTTPPCTPGVTWIEMIGSVSITQAQLDSMRGFHEGNQRPVQPLGGRLVYRVD